MLAMRRIQPRTTMILTTFLAAVTNSKISQMTVRVIHGRGVGELIGKGRVCPSYGVP